MLWTWRCRLQSSPSFSPPQSPATCPVSGEASNEIVTRATHALHKHAHTAHGERTATSPRPCDQPEACVHFPKLVIRICVLSICRSHAREHVSSPRGHCPTMQSQHTCPERHTAGVDPRTYPASAHLALLARCRRRQSGSIINHSFRSPVFYCGLVDLAPS